jgi:hypothetical protein
MASDDGSKIFGRRVVDIRVLPKNSPQPALSRPELPWMSTAGVAEPAERSANSAKRRPLHAVIWQPPGTGRTTDPPDSS